MDSYIFISIQFAVALGFVIFSVFASQWLGPKIHTKKKDKNFESGIESVGNARIPFSVKYFVIAILFVLFDIEVVFLYPWAVNFKELGADALWKMAIFISTLLIGLYYIIKKKALVWE